MSFAKVTVDLAEFKKSIIKELKKELLDDLIELLGQEPDELMTRQEVAAFLKIDLSTVHNWTKKGKLQSHGIDRKVYYFRSEILAALEQIK